MFYFHLNLKNKLLEQTQQAYGANWLVALKYLQVFGRIMRFAKEH